MFVLFNVKLGEQSVVDVCAVLIGTATWLLFETASEINNNWCKLIDMSVSYVEIRIC